MLHHVLSTCSAIARVRVAEIPEFLGRHADDVLGRVFAQQGNEDALGVILEFHREVVGWLAGVVVFLALLAVVAGEVATAKVVCWHHFLFALDARIVPDLASREDSVDAGAYLEERDLPILRIGLIGH